jgi:hypothetical protein
LSIAHFLKNTEDDESLVCCQLQPIKTREDDDKLGQLVIVFCNSRKKQKKMIGLVGSLSFSMESTRNEDDKELELSSSSKCMNKKEDNDELG